MSDHSKLELKQPKLFTALERLDADLYAQVKSVARIAEDYLERITIVFPTYTQHNIEHSIRILDRMCELLDPGMIPGQPQESYAQSLSPLEIAVLIYGALLHDIGMAPDDKTIEAIKNNKLEGCAHDYTKFVERFKGDETFALQDYVRRIHAELSGRYVRQWFGESLHVPGHRAISYANEVALLCESHNYGLDWCKSRLLEESVKGPYRCNFQFCALLLRLGDILDFDARRTPYHLFKSIDLTDYSQSEWEQHLSVQSTGFRLEPSSMIEGWKSPVFHGGCKDPAIYRKVLSYFDWIEDEIRQCVPLSLSFRNAKYRLKLALPLVNRIQTEGFQVANQQLRIDYDAISQLLMGEHIYGDRMLGVRELLQNAIDACRLRLEAEAKRTSYEERYAPRIRIILDQPHGKLVFKDNGVGMNDFIINEFFLNIGKSYYRSDEFLLGQHDFQPIGRFGIGFLSCFMLADRVIVKTKHYTESVMHELELDKSSKYIVRRTEEDARFMHGTEIVLDYDFVTNPLELTAEELRAFIGKHFLLADRWVYVEDVGQKSQAAVVSDLLSKWKEMQRLDPVFMLEESIRVYASADAHFQGITGYIGLAERETKELNSDWAQNLMDREANAFVCYLDETGIRPMEQRFLPECFDGFELKKYLIYVVDKDSVDQYNELYKVMQNNKEVYSRLHEGLKRGTIFVKKGLKTHREKGILDHLKKLGHVIDDFHLQTEKMTAVLDSSSQKMIQLLKVDWQLFPTYYKFFMNDVFIGDYLNVSERLFSHPLSTLGFCLLNLRDKQLKPNLTRTGMSRESNDIFEYAMYKFTHYLALCYYQKHNPVVAEQIRYVIERFYAAKSPLLKEETLLHIEVMEDIIKSEDIFHKLMGSSNQPLSDPSV